MRITIRLSQAARRIPFCPDCGANSVRRSIARGPLERAAVFLCWLPFRCRECGRRFHRPALHWRWPEPKERRHEHPAGLE